MCSLVRASELVLLVLALSEVKSLALPKKGPAFILPEIIHYLENQECHIPKSLQSEMMIFLGIKKTPAGMVHEEVCYRPYPPNGDQVDTDTLGSFCALSFETLKTACQIPLDSTIEDIAVPGITEVSLKNVCDAIAPWVLNGTTFQPVTRQQYGEKCYTTCAGEKGPDGAAKTVNKQCYDLYYGRTVLTEMLKSSAQPTAYKDPAAKPEEHLPSNADQPKDPSSGAPTTSATRRQTTTTEVPQSAAHVTEPGLKVTNQTKITAPNNTTPEKGTNASQANTEREEENLQTTMASVIGETAAGMPSSGRSVSSAAAAASSAAAAAQSADKPAAPALKISATGMSPGVILPDLPAPKLPDLTGGAVKMSAGGEAEDPGADLTAKITPVDAGKQDGGEATEQAGGPAAEAPEQSGLSVDSAGNAVFDGDAAKLGGASAATSSTRSPRLPGDVPPPEQKLTTSSSPAIPAPPHDVSAVGDRPQPADTANVAPPLNDGELGKLPVGQEMLGDSQDPVYDDVATYEASPAKQQESIGTTGDDDFTLNEQPLLYKAPSGAEPIDTLSGVSAFKPLKEQGGSESSLFAYFMTAVILVVVVYIIFHNKKKIMGLIVEGRSSSGRRRPHSSQYRKLDSSLEEAISSQQRQQIASNIIY